MGVGLIAVQVKIVLRIVKAEVKAVKQVIVSIYQISHGLEKRIKIKLVKVNNTHRVRGEDPTKEDHDGQDDHDESKERNGLLRVHGGNVRKEGKTQVSPQVESELKAGFMTSSGDLSKNNYGMMISDTGIKHLQISKGTHKHCDVNRHAGTSDHDSHHHKKSDRAKKLEFSKFKS